MAIIPEDWPFRPGDSLEAAIAWCEENGLDAQRIERSTFAVVEEPDGTWTASGNLFELDGSNSKLLNPFGGFIKTPFKQTVTRRPDFVQEVSK